VKTERAWQQRNSSQPKPPREIAKNFTMMVPATGRDFF
jgi:hypothetical protein